MLDVVVDGRRVVGEERVLLVGEQGKERTSVEKKTERLEEEIGYRPSYICISEGQAIIFDRSSDSPPFADDANEPQSAEMRVLCAL